MLAAVLFLALTLVGMAQDEQDRRARQLRDPDHILIEPVIPPYSQAWKKKKTELKERLLLLAGLWPEPEKTPLNPRIFDEKLGRGFRVSKVYFESLPGFFVTGNLYRPDEGKVPFPAILSTHGHSRYGRLNNDRNISIIGRCIDFARQGYVVLSIDMVGYNDSLQLPHDGLKILAQLKADQPVPYEHRLFRGEFQFPTARLYGLSLGGLQLWNGIRSIDFLTSLKEVDPERIGVTGCSGGGTQTTWIMAADDRVKVAAPVNIIGTHKHPGCLCENIPGMWLEMSMVELAASFAPRPLILVSASRDPWTNQSPTREFPLIRSYYELSGAGGNITYFHTDAGHNYNPESRRAVYEWFHRYLKPEGQVPEVVPDRAEEAAELGDLRVFPDHILPEHAKSGREVVREWIESSQRQIESVFPADAAHYRKWAPMIRRKLSLLLAAEAPAPSALRYRVKSENRLHELVHRVEMIGRRGAGDWVELESTGKGEEPPGIVLLAYPENLGSLIDSKGGFVRSWIRPLVERGVQVYRIRGYASGRLRIPGKDYERWLRSDAYNRSNELNGIQDIITAMSSIREAYPEKPLLVAGLGKTGLPALFAAAVHGGADRVIVDLDKTDPGYDGELIQLLPLTSIRRIGDIRTAILLLAGKKVGIVNAGPTLDQDWYRKKVAALGLEDNLEFLPDESAVSFANLK